MKNRNLIKYTIWLPILAVFSLAVLTLLGFILITKLARRISFVVCGKEYDFRGTYTICQMLDPLIYLWTPIR